MRINRVDRKRELDGLVTETTHVDNLAFLCPKLSWGDRQSGVGFVYINYEGFVDRRPMIAL